MAGVSVRQEVVQRIWRGHDPVRLLAMEDRPLDPQGWNSGHDYLTRAIAEVRPRFVVEVGVWKGGSVITMARALKNLEIDGVVIAVDTWRGSSEHWLAGRGDFGIDNADDLGFDRGEARLYAKFVANIRAAELEDYVTPLPLDSINAAQVIKHMGYPIGVMHLDGGHDYDSVSTDLRLWWPLVQPGGILICDDYHAEIDAWVDVRRAVNDFAAAMNFDPFEHGGGKAMLRKPLS